MSEIMCKCGHPASEHAHFLGIGCMYPNGNGCDCLLTPLQVIAQFRCCHSDEAELVTLNATMPCGHAGRYVVGSGEGTNYCALCQLEAQTAQIAKLKNDIVCKRNLLVALRGRLASEIWPFQSWISQIDAELESGEKGGEK